MKIHKRNNPKTVIFSKSISVVNNYEEPFNNKSGRKSIDYNLL